MLLLRARTAVASPGIQRLGPVLTAVFIVCVPVFLVASNVLWTFNSPRIYTYGFQKYDISAKMSIPPDELERIAAELRAYFKSGEQLSDIRYLGQPFFNEREVVHLKDVKGLLQGVNALRWATLGYLLAFIAGCLALRRLAAGRALARAAVWGGGLTLGLVALAGIAFLIDFSALFDLFHRLSFDNDFWQLDPSRDNLLRLFPEEFWADAAIFLVLATVVEAALLLVADVLALRFLFRSVPEQPAESATE